MFFFYFFECSVLLHSRQHQVWSPVCWRFSFYRRSIVSSVLCILHVPFDTMFTLRRCPTLISWCLIQWKEVLLFTDMAQDRSHSLWPITVHKKHTYSNRKTFGLCVSLDNKYVLVVFFITLNLFKAGNNRRLLKDKWVINIFRNRCSFVLRLRSSVNRCVCLCVCAFVLISKYSRSPHIDVGHCSWWQSSTSSKWLGLIRW